MADYTKLLLGGCVVILFFSIGCWFWYQWQVIPYQEDLSNIERFVGQAKEVSARIPQIPENDNSVDSSVRQTVVDTEMSTDKTNMPIKASSSVDTDQRVQLPQTDTPDVPLSRFGFGPYPKTPAGWSPIPWHLFKEPEFELMTRVRIKYLEQGEPIQGVTMDNGKVYPIIDGVVYVKWATKHTPSGTARHITRLLSNIVDGERLDAIEAANGGILTVADVPLDIKLIPYDEGGVDPYTFLNLR